MMLPLPIRPRPEDHLDCEVASKPQRCKAVHIGHECGLPKGHHGRHWDFKVYRWPVGKQRDVQKAHWALKSGWTSNKPTEDGFYWLQQDGHETIVEISGIHDPSRTYVFWTTKRDQVDEFEYLHSTEGQWQGPLQPEE